MFVTKQSPYSSKAYYYLMESYVKDGVRKNRYLESYGSHAPVFHQPNLVKGDCEEYIQTLPKGSVDLIIDDPPYGITNLPWDRAPDWEKLAGLYHHVLSDNGLLYVFGRQPSLINVYNALSKKCFDFRFEIIWNRKNNTWTSNYKPLPVHENIFVFCKRGAKIEDSKFYIKNVMTDGKPYHKKRTKKSTTQDKYNNGSYISQAGKKRYPKSILEIPCPAGTVSNGSKKPEYLGYPTQKPLDLIKWIVKASTLRGDLVLDPHSGSGTSLIASMELCRRSVGVEIADEPYNIAYNRILDAMLKLPQNYLVQYV